MNKKTVLIGAWFTAMLLLTIYAPRLGAYVAHRGEPFKYEIVDKGDWLSTRESRKATSESSYASSYRDDKRYRYEYTIETITYPSITSPSYIHRDTVGVELISELKDK